MNLFYDYTTTLFKKEVEVIKNTLLKKPSRILDLPDSNKIMNETFSKFKIKEDKYKKLIKKSFYKLLEEDGDTAEYLSLLATNYLTFEILNMDPEFHMIQKTSLKNKKIIIDTNVIINLILNKSDNYDATHKIINKMNELGIQMYYTNKSIVEYLNVLNNSNMSYLSIVRNKPNMIKHLKSPFIQSYLYDKSKVKSLTWNGFYITCKLIKEKLKTFNIKEYNDNAYKKEIETDPLYGDIISIVKKSASKRRSTKTTNVATHDAYHIALIRKIRSFIDLLGPNFWFLTYDSSLTSVDNDFNRLMDISDYPSSIDVKIFLESIMPYAILETNNRDIKTAFSDLIQTEFAIIPHQIEPSLLAEVMDPWLNYKSLSDNVIQRILLDKQITDYWNHVKIIEDKEDRRKAKEKLGTIIETKISKSLDKKLQRTQKSLKLTEKQLDGVKDELEETETKIISYSKELDEKDTEITSQNIELNEEIDFNRLIQKACLFFGIILILIGGGMYLLFHNVVVMSIWIIFGFALMLVSFNWKSLKLSLREGKLEVER